MRENRLRWYGFVMRKDEPETIRVGSSMNELKGKDTNKARKMGGCMLLREIRKLMMCVDHVRWRVKVRMENNI